MEKEDKKGRIYVRPETESFESFKAWFDDFCHALGIKDSPSDTISDEQFRSLWEKLKQPKESENNGVTKK